MRYATHSDALLRFALYSGFTVSALIILLLAAIAALRFTTDRRRRNERVLSECWQPVFLHAVEGLPYAAPPIHGRDLEIILLIWIHHTESIRGAARARLRQLALELKFDGIARNLLASKNIRQRLMAIVALGRMQCTTVRDQLAGLVTDPNPMISLLAARSLLQMDAAYAIALILAEVTRREDWPLAKVAAMLGAVPLEVLATPMLNALRAAPPQTTPRLLSLLDNKQLPDAWPMLAPLLDGERPPEVIAAALKACNDPRALEAVRLLATHEQWIVRAHAASALGRLGAEEDCPQLAAMLGDREWWVRYRAAMALAQLPFMPRQDLLDLCALLIDRYSADILRQVLAETAPGAAT